MPALRHLTATCPNNTVPIHDPSYGAPSTLNPAWLSLTLKCRSSVLPCWQEVGLLRRLLYKNMPQHRSARFLQGNVWGV